MVGTLGLRPRQERIALHVALGCPWTEASSARGERLACSQIATVSAVTSGPAKSLGRSRERGGRSPLICSVRAFESLFSIAAWMPGRCSRIVLASSTNGCRRHRQAHFNQASSSLVACSAETRQRSLAGRSQGQPEGPSQRAASSSLILGMVS